MMTKQANPRRRLAVGSAVAGLVIGVVLIAIELRQGATPERALGGLAIILAYAAILLVFQNRSETVRALAGDPVDERWRTINEKALAIAAIVTSVAVVVAFALAEVTGRENWQFALIALILSATYVAGMIWHRWRM